MPIPTIASRCTAALLALAIALAVAGCREKMVYNIAGADLPELSDQPGKLSTPLNVPGGKQEAITFSSATPSVLEKYVMWLEKQGWSKLSETQEVTRVVVLLQKGSQQLTLTYTSTGGLVITGIRRT